MLLIQVWESAATEVCYPSYTVPGPDAQLLLFVCGFGFGFFLACVEGQATRYPLVTSTPGLTPAGGPGVPI